jgi:Skp family chaperone for outer membrane proteins
LNQEKVRLEGNLKALKADYARLVEEAHINRSLYAKIMFVLSAKSFDQSYRRLRYLQEFSDYRKQQVYKIEGIKVQIEHKNDSLQVHKTTKVQVVKQKETEAKILTKDQQKEKVLLTDLQKKRFSQLEGLYTEWNERINVISRKDMDNFYEHHVLHSLAITTQFEFAPGMQVMDLGSGGGFPGIPLAIFFPETQFHLVDSINKKLKVRAAMPTEKTFFPAVYHRGIIYTFGGYDGYDKV